jgi:hypothetical protein
MRILIASWLAIQTGLAAQAQPSDAVLKSCREQAIAAMTETKTPEERRANAAVRQESSSGSHDPAEQALVDQCVKNGGKL